MMRNLIVGYIVGIWTISALYVLTEDKPWQSKEPLRNTLLYIYWPVSIFIDYAQRRNKNAATTLR